MANRTGYKWMQMRGAASGFSLVEIMVGMVVGLITIIVIMQSFAAFEGQKRTTSSGSDTQENGLIALHAIEGDARTAGYGLLTPKGLACTAMNYYEDGVTAVPASAPVAPVAVADGGAAGGSDTLVFTAATSPIAGMPSKLNADMQTAQAEVYIDNTVGFNVDRDLYLVAAPILSPGVGAVETPCSRMAYTERCPADTTQPEVACSGKAFLSASSPVAVYNSSDPNFFQAARYPANSGFVINLGSGLNGAAGFARTQYSVVNTGLVATDMSHMVARNSVVLSGNIVNMQVQYGVAPINPQPGASSQAVNCWTDARGNACNSGSGNWAAPNASDIMRIKAIRIAIVARSSLRERPATPGAACDATTVAPISWAGGPTIDLTPNDTATDQWQCHRYRVYQTIIPLRNVIWANI